MNCRGGSENCNANSFVTAGDGAVEGGKDGRGTLAIAQVRPGIANRVAYSVSGGRWFPLVAYEGVYVAGWEVATYC
jgi:hypothetical protein